MIKRTFDIVVAGAALVMLLPILMLIGLAIRITMGAPVLFRQRRPGLAGSPFEIIKFRTMRAARDDDGGASDMARTTRLGSFLRGSSLDELPELWNVMKGEMSLVGPRPLLMDYLPLYSERQRRRHELRPGITGWAQVNGRNAISWSQKFELDLWYVEHQSFALDIRIMVMTVARMVSRRGVNAGAGETMPRFTGMTEEAEEAGQD